MFTVMACANAPFNMHRVCHSRFRLQTVTFGGIDIYDATVLKDRATIDP